MQLMVDEGAPRRSCVQTTHRQKRAWWLWGSETLCVCRSGLGARFKDQGARSNQRSELLWEAVSWACGKVAGGSVGLGLGPLVSHGRFLRG